MQTLARIALVLVLMLMILSAYLRLDHSGIGCEPWPECYGNIGVVKQSPSATSTYERLLEEAQQPLSWATPLHRLVASALGLLVLGMMFVALRQKQNRVITFGLLCLTVFLAWLGIYSEGLHSPAIVMGNLCGGFAMLGLLGWLVCNRNRTGPWLQSTLQRVSMLALLTLCLQIFIGGLTSANFAASACQTLPDCHGSWLPGAEVTAAFDLSRTHEIGATGLVLGGPERAAIHKLHRLIAIVTVLTVLLAGFFAVRAGGDLIYVGIGVFILVITEFALGAAAIIAQLPIGITVAHNWIAAILLLSLLKLYSESTAGFA